MVFNMYVDYHKFECKVHRNSYFVQWFLLAWREAIAFVWTWPSSWIVGIGKCSSNPTKWALWSWRCVVRNCPSIDWDATRPLPCQSCIHPHNLGVWFHSWQRKSRWWKMLIFCKKHIINLDNDLQQLWVNSVFEFSWFKFLTSMTFLPQDLHMYYTCIDVMFTI